MKTIRITAPIVTYGAVQFLQGRVKPLPDKLADALVASGDAEFVNAAEYATMQRKVQTAVVARPPSKPKTKPKGR